MYAEPEFESSTTEKDEPQGEWRNEVASRLSSYKARRRRKVEGNYSMKLDFEPEGPETPSREALVAAMVGKFHHDDDVADTNYYRRLNAETVVAEPEPGPDFFDIDLPEEPQFVDESEPTVSGDPEYAPIKLEAEPVVDTAPYDPENDPDFNFDAPRADEPEQAVSVGSGAAAAPAREKKEKPKKLIHFPRPAGMEPPLPPPAYDFAEPMIDRPRIMDVPEDTMPTIRGPLFAEIRLDDQQTEEAVPKFQAQIDVPLQVAAMNQRVFAGLIDLLIIVVATAVFSVIGWNVVPEIPRTKETAVLALLIPAVFWFVYQYLFLVYAGQTTGMQMAQLRLRTFDGRHPEWAERKHRALAMLLSCISVGLGFVWSMVDEDTLCWHDKISRTYTVQER